jgi:hypothetical protein
VAYQPELTAEVDGFYQAATRLHKLDPVVTEMVRLRCARRHDCRICKAVRLREAYAAGVDESMTAKIDFFEQSDLDERIKVALRYTDAFLNDPSAVDARLSAQLAGHFSPAQVVEMSLDIMKWSTQKIHVTLGLDVMPGVDVEGGALTFFGFTPDGRPADFVSAEQEELTPTSAQRP